MEAIKRKQVKQRIGAGAELSQPSSGLVPQMLLMSCLTLSYFQTAIYYGLTSWFPVLL